MGLAENFLAQSHLNRTLNFVRAVLHLFKAVPNLEGEKSLRYILRNERNLANGFFITEKAFRVCPCVASRKFLHYIKGKFGCDIAELNRGFYKSFGTVANSTPQKILANKLMHYFSTYGLESLGLFDRNLVYVPNDVLELPADAKPIKITVIDAIDNADIIARTTKLIQSGAALSAETLEAVLSVTDFLDINPNVDDIPNKELVAMLCDRLRIIPKNPVQFLRCMIYKVTGSTLLIKSYETIDAVRNSAETFDDYFSRYIAENGAGQLASIFHRFKPLWLAFKPHSDYMRTTVNKIRKLADRHHKPVTPKLLEHLTSAENVDIDELRRELAAVTTFKKISLAAAILYRMNEPEHICFAIRNGKAFVKDYSANLKFDAEKIFGVIADSIADDIRPNVSGKRIYIPERFDCAVPTSEKKFFGNVPCGSTYTFAANAIVAGVHWLNLVDEDGCEIRVDLDLHMNGNGLDIGWQNDFSDENFINTKERKIIFSGDMTDAPVAGGGATEAFFIGESFIDDAAAFNLNHYNRDRYSKSVPFKLILADVNQERIDRKYLLDAHEIAFCVPGKINSGEMFVGFLTSDKVGKKKFHFLARNMGDRNVARSNSLTAMTVSAMNTAAKSQLHLSDILTRAGAILTGVTADDCDINLDPTESAKDTLLSLLGK